MESTSPDGAKPSCHCRHCNKEPLKPPGADDTICNSNVIVVDFFNRHLDHSRVLVLVGGGAESNGHCEKRLLKREEEEDEIVGEKKKQVKETRSLIAKERFSAALAA